MPSSDCPSNGGRMWWVVMRWLDEAVGPGSPLCCEDVWLCGLPARGGPALRRRGRDSWHREAPFSKRPPCLLARLPPFQLFRPSFVQTLRVHSPCARPMQPRPHGLLGSMWSLKPWPGSLLPCVRPTGDWPNGRQEAVCTEQAWEGPFPCPVAGPGAFSLGREEPGSEGGRRLAKGTEQPRGRAATEVCLTQRASA